MISFNLPVCLPADFFRLMMVQLLWQKDCQTVFFYLIFHAVSPLSVVSFPVFHDTAFPGCPPEQKEDDAHCAPSSFVVSDLLSGCYSPVFPEPAAFRLSRADCASSARDVPENCSVTF